MADFVKKHLKLITESTREALIHEDYWEFSRQGWFLYFWKEARDQAGINGRAADVLPFFNELYVLPDEWDLSKPECQIEEQGPFYGYKGAVAIGQRVKVLAYKPGKTWDNVDDNVLYRLLDACLKVGFERIRVVPQGNELGEIATDSPLAFARHCLILDQAHQYSLGWRGDSRSLKDLSTAGGFKSKAQSDNGGLPDSYAEKIQTRKPWHPFSRPENRSDYYFRKMQQDNCLHTVVSITLDFVTASTFPKVEDMLATLFNGHEIKPGDTVDGLAKPFKDKLCKVVTGTGKKEFRYADRQQLYLVLLFGHFFDTQKRQSGNPFPEVAVKQIPVKNILGSLSFVRVFNGLHEAEGFTAFYDAKNSKGPSMERIQAFAGEQSLARTLWPKLQEEWNKIVTSMPYHARWTGSGGQKFGTTERFWQVTKPDGSRLI